MSESKDSRVLSVQSHVVSGYVGNKSACFPLQVLGFDVDTINSVQFSNHTGYHHFRGQVLNSSELDELIEGLRLNNLLNYSHLLTGYVGSPSFLKQISAVVKELKRINPEMLYVCDPVMGDQGQMYVPQECLPIYRDEILTHADILTPNQFEAELLTGVPINSEYDAFEAMNLLHDKGIKIVVLTSTNFGTNENTLVGLASSRNVRTLRLRLEMPKYNAIFTGTGDLFAATFLAWMSKSEDDLKSAVEHTVNTVQAILKRTYDYAKEKSKLEEKFKPHQLELRLVQSRDDIITPKNIFNVTVTEL